MTFFGFLEIKEIEEFDVQTSFQHVWGLRQELGRGEIE
jgi:hypothetical protein